MEGGQCFDSIGSKDNFKKLCLWPGIYTELNVKVHTENSTWGSTLHHIFEPMPGKQCNNGKSLHNSVCPRRACAASNTMTAISSSERFFIEAAHNTVAADGLFA